MLATFAIFMYGVMRLGWDFDRDVRAVLCHGRDPARLIGGLRLDGTAKAFVTGFAAKWRWLRMVIGFARAIFVVLEQGNVIDTVVNGLVTPLATLPVTVCALAMEAIQAALHVPVPSVSGQAVLTMPVLVPMST